MVESKTQLLWLETTNNKTRQLGRNIGIPKTQLGFSLNQYYLRKLWWATTTMSYSDGIINNMTNQS